MRTGLRNLPYIIVYLAGLFLLFLTAIFYRQPLLSVFLMLLLIMPILSVYAFIKTLPHLSADLKPEEREYECGTNGRLILSVNNPTFLPLLNCRLFFSIMNMYYPDDHERELLFAAEAKNDKKIYLPVTYTRAGMIRINVNKLVISDPLHMYTKELPIGRILEVPVMPEVRQIQGARFYKSEAEDEDSVWTPDGELTRDIKDIRDYRPGDRLKDIHWLLAARTDELPVKEYERARELYFLLLPELRESDLDKTLETFYSLATRLLKEGEIYRVALYKAHEDIVVLRTADSDEALREVMYEMYRESVSDVSYAYDRLMAIYPDAHGVIRISGESVTEM